MLSALYHNIKNRPIIWSLTFWAVLKLFCSTLVTHKLIIFYIYCGSDAVGCQDYYRDERREMGIGQVLVPPNSLLLLRCNIFSWVCTLQIDTCLWLISRISRVLQSFFGQFFQCIHCFYYGVRFLNVFTPPVLLQLCISWRCSL